MNNITTVSWLGDLAFSAELNGHKIMIDSSLENGGKNQGPRPKGFLLVGLAGCTGMDVVSILKKMKIEKYQLQIQIHASQTEEHPKIYDRILVEYLFTGKDLPLDKLKRAVELSETRYCGVSAMLRQTAVIETKITINQGDPS